MHAVLGQSNSVFSRVLLCLAVVAGTTCGAPADADREAGQLVEDDEHAAELLAGVDEILEIPEAAQRNAGLRIVRAEERELPMPLEVTGVVTPDTSRVVHLRPLTEGVIQRVDVTLGDRVRAGQELVEYDNAALGDHIAQYRSAGAVLRQAEADLEVRRRNFERAEDLIGIEAIAQQIYDLRRAEYEQARAGVMSAQAEVIRIEERIHRFGLTDEDLLAVTPVDSTDPGRVTALQHREASLNVLRAPFDGVVTEYGVAVGDLAGPERELLTITDLSTVWVLADVYEPDLGRIQPGVNVAIRTQTYPDRVFTGRVTYVSDTIEQGTRAAHVRCVVANPDHALKLGMFARVTLQTTETMGTVTVPVDAIQQVDGQSVVFVQTGPTTFARRDVTLGATTDGLVAVLSGLALDEPLVATGSFYLKTALLHERIGHSH